MSKKAEFFAWWHRNNGKSCFAAERQFEMLSEQDRYALALLARVEPKPHLRDYSWQEQQKIGFAVRRVKRIAHQFALVVQVQDFNCIDYEVDYASSECQAN